MDEMEQKLGSILANPQLMQQIMAMAQTIGQQPQKDEPKPEPPQPTLPQPSFDPVMLQRMMGLARQSGIDNNQQNLLRALSPYLSRDRIGKLERAMRAAKLASLATAVLRSSGFQLFSGR